MTKREKQKYVKKHFSKKCIIFLSDVTKSKYFQQLKNKNNTIFESSFGRRKHSCYICFQKFFTKEDLTSHKFIHISDKSNDTFSDDNETEQGVDTEKQTEEFIDTNEKSNAVFSDDDNKIEKSSLSKDEQIKSTAGSNDDNLKSEETIKDATSSEFGKIEATANDETSKCFTTETKYKCLKCEVYFNNQVDVKAHVHTQYYCKYYCKQCDRQFNTKGGFIVHVLQHDMTNISKLSYRCNKCPYSFDDCYKLKRHYATAHNVENKSTAKYAESIINSKDDPSSSIDKPKEITSEKENTSIISAKEIDSNPSLSSLEKIIKDLDNPITGNIPIFDCDVCYDVFASEKALNRHKYLHKRLEKNPNDNIMISMVIDDDEIEVVQKDDLSDKHEIVSNFVAAHKPASLNTPMAKLTPIRPLLRPGIFKPKVCSNSFILPKQQDSSISKCTTPTGNDSPKSVEMTGTDSVVDKTKITSEITEMLAGKKFLPKKRTLKFMPVSKPKPVKKYQKSVLKKSLKVPADGISLLQTITKNPTPPMQTDISLPAISPKMDSETDQPKYMYVMCPQNNTQSGGMPSGGQAFMMIDPSSGISSPTTNFVFKNEANTGTILPSSRPNQFIINQQINTGGVVINPQSGNLPGSGFVFNQNVEGKAVGIQEPRILQSFSGLHSPEAGQMFYVVMPSNQGEAGKQNIELYSVNPQVPPQQTIMPVMQQELGDKYNTMMNTNLIKGLKSDNFRNVSIPQKHQTSDSESFETMTMPIITSISTEEARDEDSSQEIQKDNSTIVMPIITSIGTVAEDSVNKKEKVRKDPVSKYESEFAKFLNQGEEGTTQIMPTVKTDKSKGFKKIVPKNTKPSKDSNKETLKALRASRPRKAIVPKSTTTANDEVILLDDDSSSNELASKGDTENAISPLVTIGTSPYQETSSEQIKPKIFLKKLSDLLDSSKSPMRENQTGECPDLTPFRHCCLRCNIQLKDWYELRIHLKSLHDIYACVYNGCSVLNSLDEYRNHIKQAHHCFTCRNDFCDLRHHQLNCFLQSSSNNVQSSESNKSVGENITESTSI